MPNYIYGRKIPIRVLNTSNFIGGIADFEKLGAVATYAFGRAIDVRSDPRGITIQPSAVKESGTVVTDLPIWAERVLNRVSLASTTYAYGSTGNIYSRSSTGSWSFVRNVANSSGNGLRYYGEDDYLYYPSNKSIGRYGPVSGSTPQWVDDWLTTQGGVPTNTYSLSLASASSRYATAASSASLQVTSDLTLESWFNPTSLPSVGNSMTLVGKWDESGATRGYKLDIYAVSGYFGDGSDGVLTIAADTTEAPIDASCTGTSGAYTLSATNVSFATGQVIMIHQSQGTGAGSWMRNTIQGYTAGTITLSSPLNTTYVSGAQVRVLKQYSAVTVNSAKIYSAKAWNGTVGGIIAFLCSGTVTVSGTISALGGNGQIAGSTSTAVGGTGGGFRGGNGLYASQAQCGEGTSGAITTQNTTNGNGGGGSYEPGAGGGNNAGGGGGGNGSAGGTGVVSAAGTGGAGGSTAGTSDLTTMVFGGGGGGGSSLNTSTSERGGGGAGGGIVFITTTTFTNSGAVSANGGAPGVAAGGFSSGGGGAGGSILIKAQTATLGSGIITATGGLYAGGSYGANGGDGRVHLDYYTSYTGSSSPTITVLQDNTLSTSTSYQARLGISNDGTANEYLTKVIAITTGLWWHLAISWVASTSTATFYLNGVSQGTTVGTKTAISSNVSLLYVGANKTSVAANFFDGLIDETRVWAAARVASDVATYMSRQLVGTETNLKAYWQYNNTASDITANANNLTLVNSPTYSQNVPFSAPTTRLDIDQQATGVGNTYTTPTAIDEAASARISFVPAKDPQKSIDFNISGKGTGNWTVTIHDPYNNVIATSTVTNASLSTGFYEFTYANVWRPVIGATYHAHVTSTVADGTVVTGTASSLPTLGYHTYYQFLVNDVYHPVERILNAIGIGNERYLATWDASTYNPMRLKFPAGVRVRSIAKWREYWAIGCWYFSAITDADQGIVFLWDGSSVTYNAFFEVPEGGVNAMFGENGTLYIVAGYKGDLLEYTGGDNATKAKRLPKVVKDPTKYVEVLPGAMTIWGSLLRIGVAGNSDSSVIEKGVYTYGHLNTDLPNSITYDYPISTGNRSSTVKIGMLLPLDRKLLVSWQDGTGFGVDVVDPVNNSPYSSSTVELGIDDVGVLWKEKRAEAIRADFLPLRAGESIDIKYKINRATNWTNLGAVTTVGATKAYLPLPATDERHHEVQIAADLFTTTTTSPTLTELSYREDFLLDEQNCG